MVYRDGEIVSMTYHEFFTLLYLAQHPGWVFSKEQIYSAVWKEPETNCRAAVTNVVSQIRRKIGDGYIETMMEGTDIGLWDRNRVSGKHQKSDAAIDSFVLSKLR